MKENKVDFDIKIQFLQTLLNEIEKDSYYYGVVNQIITDITEYSELQSMSDDFIEFVMDTEEPLDPKNMN